MIAVLFGAYISEVKAQKPRNASHALKKAPVKSIPSKYDPYTFEQEDSIRRAVQLQLPAQLPRHSSPLF